MGKVKIRDVLKDYLLLKLCVIVFNNPESYNMNTFLITTILLILVFDIIDCVFDTD